MQQLLVVSCWIGDYFASLFTDQDTQETPFSSYEEFVVGCAYTQNVKFVRHIEHIY
jgi:hypothetical protein